MNNWEELSSVIDQVLDLDPEERLPFVEQIYGEQPELRAIMIRYLESIGPSEKLWDKLVESGSVLANEITSSDTDTDTDTDASPLCLPLEKAGPYRIIELIASGGMGDVYLAERSDGQFDRTVAIKVLRHELCLKKHIERFSSERNILSGLEHPNIARLYDGGITEDNRPYLVMEYVDGVPITSYCIEKNCSLTEKIDLFKQVCKAVEFAHRNLIVHRDLKPDNILVKTDGTVKILDFGIAKIIDEELSPELLIQTGENLHMLSIQYAAPEQVTLEKITTATDVYSLGLLLYEVISGRSPFNLQEKTLKEAKQIIRFEEPAKPSTAIQNSGQSRKVKGDLDAIIIKTLRKEPGNRYVSVDQLMQDIRRHQTHLPVHARSQSVQYHLSKFIRRNKGVVFAVVIVALAVWGFTAFHLSEVKKQKEIALAGRQQADFVTGYLTDLFQSASPANNQGDTISVFNLLDLGKDDLSALDDNFLAKPNLLTAFANSYLNLGNYDEAISFYEQAYEITQSAQGISEQLANSAIQLGNAHSANRKFDIAAIYYEEVLEIINKLEGDFSHLKAGFLGKYAMAVLEIGDIERSFQILEEARYLHSELNLTSGIFSNLDEMRSFARAYRHNEQYEESEKLYREILQIYGQKTDLYGIHNDLAYLLVQQERPAEAINYYSKSLDSHRNIYREDHPKTLMVLGNLAGAYSYDEQYKKAEVILLQRIPLIKQRYGEYHWRVGSAKEGLGRFYVEINNFERAEELFFEAYSIYNEVLGASHNWTAISTIYLAYCKAVNGLTDESDTLFRDSYAILYSDRDNFHYYVKIMLEKLLTNLNIHPLDIWKEEIAMLEKLKK